MHNALLSELFGGEKRFALLRALYLSPGKQHAPAELARLAGTDSGNVARWLKRWADIGLVVRTQDGRNVLYRASDSPLLNGLADIVRRSDALLEDVKEALPPEVETAVVFGSVARGEEKASSDLDVLVLGEELSTIRIHALLKSVGRKHGREIHASVFSRPEFEQMLADGNSFAIGITQQPTIALKGELAHGRTQAATTGG
ncbi:nucleotidyltransferase domain-containing protein [Cupriavidus necator]|uniref:nucleotidyltransferase domain-containing protein n=1 Tax=Cupriavidus necator TaxID=106590 RepID=UPI00339D7290